MKRILLAWAFSSMLSLALASAASATAGLGCSAADKNVAVLEFEGLLPREATRFVNLTGSLEIVAGDKIEFSASNVKTFNWGKNIALRLTQQTPRGLVDISIYAKPVDEDNLDFEGSYVVRLGKLRKSGKIKCSGG